MNIFSNNQLFSSLHSVGIFVLLGFALISCNPDNGADTDEDNFDRAAMLTEVADELIIPNFKALQSNVNAMHSAVLTFNQNPTETNLLSIRTSWEAAVTDHQHCSAFGFGPAKLLLGAYAEVLGAFPVDTTQVEQNIVNDNFDLPNSFDRDVRGFYTVEYLIYGTGASDADIVAGFDQDRKDYLLLITNELKNTFDAIVSEWEGSYRAEFIASTGTSAGSSMSLYYNAFVKDYENLKNFKLELPAGLSAGQASSEPGLVEAYYSGISRSLIFEHFENCKNIWSGTTRDGDNILGFEEYLATLVGGPALVDQTQEAIAEIDTHIALLPNGELSANIDDPAVSNLRDKLQENTANFKSSLSSLLGISITFNSGDGD